MSTKRKIKNWVRRKQEGPARAIKRVFNHNFHEKKKHLLNVLRPDFKIGIEDISTTDYRPVPVTVDGSDVVLQNGLFGTSTNGELEVQFKNGNQRFGLQRDVRVTFTHPALWNIARKFLIAFPCSVPREKRF